MVLSNYVQFLMFLIYISTETVIAPKRHLNHRLTYVDGPKIINSSVHENTRIDDYFIFADEFTYLTNSDLSLCVKPNNELYTCPKSTKSTAWKIDNVRREARFRDAYGDCLTVGKYDVANDSYTVELKDCSEADEDQVFILFKDHGKGFASEITSENINSVDEAEKRDFRNQYSPYK
jgi:hypothetical protein